MSSDMLKDIAFNRCREICDELAKQGWYKRIEDEMLKVRKSIVDAGMGELIDTYDDLCTRMNCRTEEEIYAAAFKDGINTR
jgi:hypothetical protein